MMMLVLRHFGSVSPSELNDTRSTSMEGGEVSASQQVFKPSRAIDRKRASLRASELFAGSLEFS